MASSNRVGVNPNRSIMMYFNCDNLVVLNSCTWINYGRPCFYVVVVFRIWDYWPIAWQWRQCFICIDWKSTWCLWFHSFLLEDDGSNGCSKNGGKKEPKRESHHSQHCGKRQNGLQQINTTQEDPVGISKRMNGEIVINRLLRDSFLFRQLTPYISALMSYDSDDDAVVVVWHGCSLRRAVDGIRRKRQRSNYPNWFGIAFPFANILAPRSWMPNRRVQHSQPPFLKVDEFSAIFLSGQVKIWEPFLGYRHRQLQSFVFVKLPGVDLTSNP